MLSVGNLQSLRGLILVTVLLTACSRVTSDEEGSGSVSIQIPTAEKLQASGKVGAFSAVDVSKMCFGINVMGPGIETSLASSCDVERGIVAGSVVAGGTLTVEVNVGDDRVFEVYGFLRDSASDPCPTLKGASWGFPIAKIYDLGKSAPTKVTKAGGSVSISVTLPEASDNIVVKRSWSPSCASVGGGGGGGLPGTRIVEGSALAVGTTVQTRAHIGSMAQEQISVGTTVQTRGARVGN